MDFSEKDRRYLRDLAQQQAKAAADPVMAERRRLWIEHNSLRPARPMILVYPEGAWQELLPPSRVDPDDKVAQRVEFLLARQVYMYEHFDCDNVIEREWVQPAVIGNTGWGLTPRRHAAPAERGAYGFDPVIKDASDLTKLQYPEVMYDETQTQANLVYMQDLLGDILEVKPKGVFDIVLSLAVLYIRYRGLTEMMMDLAAEPRFAHDLFAFFAEGRRRMLRQYQEMNLFSLNNDNTYNSSGGNGYTDQLPKSGCAPDTVRPRDVWAFSEAQEFAQVSPEMHEEFVWQHERSLLESFGLTGYGCCEDLTRKLHFVTKLPTMRRISISPWADVESCAEQLQGNFIFSWKPNPAHLVGRFDEDAIRCYVRHTLEVCQSHGCCLEIILKDTHTVEHHPERFDIWTRVVRQEVNEYAA